MSRIGNKPISIPDGVTVNIINRIIEVGGAKGSLKISVPDNITINIKDKTLTVSRKGEDKRIKSMHGMVRSEIDNAICGVTKGWSKIVSLVGVGYRAETDGKRLTLNVGFSHPVIYNAPENITLSVKGNDITISGFSAYLVGETTAEIRRIRPPEIYKGKGIRYKGEIIKTKPGKAAKTVGGAVGGGTAAAKK